MSAVQALCFDDLNFGAMTRQRQLPQHSSGNFSNRLHHEMGLLHDFFRSMEGGPQFWSEIYGDLAEPKSKRRAAE